ncbi:DUF6716 putative glycosyltransferase [Isoptericola sp. BMS4]|uniref:DUF6716 putative glycosyltransferase n=1 Tax=Isoptericola sp. BMS4 TaxID=2527875 RepID=UPI00142011E6|nr:DUF6716 putative glycosyltransferase [Isoptericola sp. BMS4]
MSAPRVLAVADSDSYLKWAVWTLARLRDDAAAGRTDVPQVSAVVVRSPIAPTPEQAAAAVTGTGLPLPPVLSPAAVRRLARRARPDVVLVAATGPVAELVARHVVGATAPHRPALVAGLPGMALPATEPGTGWRRWCDAFLVHARVERAPYAAAFAAHGATPELALTRLPFLARAPHGDGEHAPGAGLLPGLPGVGDRARPAPRVRRAVLAAQAKVPSAWSDRVHLLDGIARLSSGGLDVVVKLRARSGERQTHNEAHPLDALWAAEHRRLGHAAGTLRFATGPMSGFLTPGTALLTVSSTAALESLALSLPTVFLADFGVGPELLNPPFAGSGCLLHLDEVAASLRAGGPVPDPAWCAEHYLHDDASQVPAVVARLTERARAGTLPERTVSPWSWKRHGWTVLRSAVPAALT